MYDEGLDEMWSYFLAIEWYAEWHEQKGKRQECFIAESSTASFIYNVLQQHDEENKPMESFPLSILNAQGN